MLDRWENPAGRVAVHPWDVAGAVLAGLVGAWPNRSAAAYPPYLTGPAVTALSLPALADLLLGG